MPFKSEAQRRLMWAKHPEIARRWAHKYGSGVSRSKIKSAAASRLKSSRTPVGKK